jgi:hypothetical protein
MPAANRQMAASAFIGALTSVFVTAASTFVSDPTLRPIVSIMAGLTASIVVFEILSWLVVLRLILIKGTIKRIIPSIESIQEQVIEGLTKQKLIMSQSNASASSIREIEKMQLDGSIELARAITKLQTKSIDLIHEINKV